jgi:hypothetical protein
MVFPGGYVNCWRMTIFGRIMAHRRRAFGRSGTYGRPDATLAMLAPVGPTKSMDDASREELAGKLRFSLAMSDDGFAMKRQQLRRRNPDADEAEIDRLFRSWL